MPSCTECTSLFVSVRDLEFHYKFAHDIYRLKIFRCKEFNCFRDFPTWKSFKKHLLAIHSSTDINKSNSLSAAERKSVDMNNICNADTQGVSDNFHNVDNNDCDPTYNCGLNYVQNYTAALPVILKEKVEYHIQLVCSKLYADPNLSRIQVQSTMDSTQELVGNILNTIKPALYENMTHLNISHVNTVTIDNTFDTVLQLFDNLSTDYNRLQYFQKLGLIKPVSVCVGSILDEKYKNGKIIKELSPVYSQIIPLRQTLKSFLELPNVLSTVIDYINTLKQSSVLSNFIQGELWREKVNLHFKDKTVIPLFLYYDDFEVNNPLGSHAGIQKLGAVYCTIPCLPPQFRSTLENIFLVNLFHASDRVLFGNGSIFKPIVDEINYLQSYGLQFKIDGIDRTIYFALGLILGDNLGLNSALGFTESFRAHHFCRLCYTAAQKTQKNIFAVKADTRVINQYDNDVDNGVKKSGIKESSIWNKVAHFHVYMNFYADILHDIDEGAMKYGVSEILYHYVIKAANTIEIEIINDRIRTFNYTLNGITNKPPPIRLEDVKNKRCSFSASEMFNFFIILPLLIGDLIDGEDSVWQYYLILREIVELVSAKELQVECSYLLDVFVSEHHQMYTKLFKTTLKPKHHLMTHYGLIMRKSGPLSALSTIRYESKHKYFKECANSTASRKNVTYTIALKQQFSFYHRCSICKRGLVPKFKAGPTISSKLENSYDDFPSKFHNSIEVPWIKLNGIRYNIGTCIVTAHAENVLPTFAKIICILYNEAEQVILRCAEFDTIQCNETLRAYEIEANGNYIICKPENFFNPFPAIVHTMGNGVQYATLKSML